VIAPVAAPADPAGQSAPSPAARRRRPLVVERNSRAHLALVVVGVLAVVGVIIWGSGLGAFNQGQLTRVMIYACAIAGLNIATGYTGMISVGHSAFFGLGAYTTAVLVVKAGWQPLYTIPIAFVICFLVGLIVGLPALRIKGLYFAMVTLAFGVAFPEIIDTLDGLTGGSQGITIRRAMLRPPSWSGFSLAEKDIWLYWVSTAVLLIVMVVVHNLVRSRYGLAMTAVRDNEIAAAASGINLAVIKTVSFGMSGALTGVGGSLFAMYLGSLVADDSFTLLSGIALLTGLIVGGQATRFGPIIGAVAVVYIPYYTGNIGQGQASAVIFGAILILLMFLAPEGLNGGLFRLLGRVFRVVPATPAPRRPTPPPGRAAPTDTGPTDTVETTARKGDPSDHPLDDPAQRPPS
jgi:branched-chain amino acid transport system permease protein